MSKLGKKPIQIPKDTKVIVESGKLILSGPKGSKELSINEKIFSASISKNNNLILNPTQPSILLKPLGNVKITIFVNV